MTRAERAVVVRRLRDDGLTHREIATRLGSSRAYAAELDTDPTGEKARVRKAGYGGTCVDCGVATNGSDGPGKAPELCIRCTNRAKKVWTREAVIDAIQRWARVHGRQPTASDWLHADPDGNYPNRCSVYRKPGSPGAPFATWNDAIRAAGFEPRPFTHWTRDSILDAIRAWAAEHGAPPTLNEWRHAEDGHPSYGTLVGWFGSWNAGIAAAGFTPRPSGRTRRYDESRLAS